MDYSSVIVHIMTPQMNKFYKLEKRWKDAEFMDIKYLVIDDGNGDNLYSAEDDAVSFSFSIINAIALCEDYCDDIAYNLLIGVCC